MSVCDECGYRLTPVYPNQRLHPMCDPAPPGLTDAQRDELIARIESTRTRGACDMSAPMPLILRGDARALPLADDSVDLIVTSPPYFSLRDYGTDNQIGNEETPAQFIEALLEVTRECARVLKPAGSMFVNLGDKYAERTGPARAGGRDDDEYVQRPARRPPRGRRGHIRPKSLMLLPERYRIACVDELDLIARAVIVWSKPNGLPESVTDRVRRSHEDWVHLTKQPRYFSAVDEIREPHAPAPKGKHDVGSTNARKALVVAGLADGREQRNDQLAVRPPPHPRGKLPGSVWTIPTQPLRVPAHLGIDHFAAFPMEWPRRIINGWSPREVCSACGEGRRPNRGRACDACGEFIPTQGKSCGACGYVRDWKSGRVVSAEFGATDWSTAGHGTPRHPGGHTNSSVTTGYVCACPDTSAESTPGVVLDPFGGTGTTALVATMLGRRGISVDLSADYCRLAEWRASDPKERARAAGLDPDAVAKVTTQLPGQESLLDLLDGAAS